MGRNTDGEQDSGSEGDAPEQVSLSSGRDAANKLRKEERENRTRVQAEAKKRRQKKSLQKKKADVQSDEQQVASAASLVQEDGGIPIQNDQGEEQREPEGTDLLDDSVVQFLVAQEKKAMDISTVRKEKKTQKQKRKVTVKQKGREANNPSSRVKVVLLESDVPTLANVHRALEFKRNRLYGEGIQRSLCMLPKTRVR